ncbi:MAG: hypothetical protein Q8P29_02700 [Candidatus Levybacteria bacterium]|nr:hypothetical protein [Candidatus Levybacteria bacterium]
MIEKKAIFIIPGFNHLITNKAYREIAKILKKENYFPILVKIPWKNTTILENTKYFLNEYKKIKLKKKYILGFSFGAMIAFIASTKVRSSGLILCSLSPFFKEDLPMLKTMTKKNKYFYKLSCASLAKKIKSKQILMMYGSQEARSLIRRVTDTFSRISSANKFLISIYKAEHDIGDKRYLAKIHQAVKVLN